MTVSSVSFCVGIACSALSQQNAAPPDLPASRCCFDFRVSFQDDYASTPEPIDNEWSIEGACFGSRWHMTTIREGAGGRADIACDGARVFIRTGSSVIIEPLAQRSIPMELWSLAPLLQLGSELYGDATTVGGSRWSTLAGGGRVTQSEPSEQLSEFAYEWRLPDGVVLDRMVHAIETVNGKPFFRSTMSESFRGETSAKVKSIMTSEMKVEGEFAVGEGLVGKSLKARCWMHGPSGGEGALPLLRTMSGTLDRCAVLDETEFDRRLASRTTLAAGMRILDRTRPAVLGFNVGEAACSFDGVSYQLSSALNSPPTDLELMQLLREATHDNSELETRVAKHGGSRVAADPLAPLVPPTSIKTASNDGLIIEPSRVVDLGVVRFANLPTTAQAVFRVRNASEQARPIKSVKASCGCTATSADCTSIDPGATATITTTLTVERAKTYHSSIWIAFEDGQIEELQIVAVGVPEKAIRATAMRSDPAGDVMTVVLYSESGKPEGDVGVPKDAEPLIASDSGWIPIGGDASRAKHWIRDIVKKPTQ
jgi:hypothetical protein